MSTISGFSSALSAATTLPPLATPALGKGPKAAREFEAQLIGTVLQSLEKTFAAVPGHDEMAGEDNYNYLGSQALASAMAAGGGLGIARMIVQHLGNAQRTHEGPAPTASHQVSGR
jgi:Rod binding domain-containing protein